MLRFLVICLCVLLAFSANQVPVSCPSSPPQGGSKCPLTGNAWMKCSYNRTTCCPGTSSSSTIYKITADCRNGQWTVQTASCPTCAPTCPASVPSSGSSCTGTVQCQYGKNMTCCDGSVQFSGQIAQCSGSQWRIGIADGCLFGCAGSTCPASVPSSGSSCTGTVQCQYGKNMTCCDGSVQFSGQIAQCSGSQWRIGIADGCLFGCADSTCPSSAPTSPSCTGNVSCKYGKNTTCCNGAVQYVGSIVSCVGGSWVTAIADGCMFACDNQCPASSPKNGDYCTFDTTVTCKYGSGTAKCTQGKWVVTSGVFTNYCPATAPSSGQSCSTNGAAYIHCQYDRKSCPCGGSVYQTDAWCRSTSATPTWEVNALSCAPCTLQSNLEE